MRPHLRNSHINYHHGWFFITFQIHENKSELGAIVGDQCVLNPLGQAVAALIESLPRYNPEIYLDCYVVMPNHVHLILKIADSPYNSPNHLGKIVCKLKSLASKAYRDLKQQGKARDIGSHLWQENYWEKIITTYEQLQKIRTYIRTNPVNWSHDRFGEVTTYHLGNMNLLNQPLLAFVASQESYAGGDAPAPQEKNSRGQGRRAPHFFLGGRGRRAPHSPSFQHLQALKNVPCSPSSFYKKKTLSPFTPEAFPVFYHFPFKKPSKKGRPFFSPPFSPARV